MALPATAHISRTEEQEGRASGTVNAPRANSTAFLFCF